MRPSPDDLVATADLCSTRLLELEDADWDAPVDGLDWSCRQTLVHLGSLAYAPVLASRMEVFRPLALAVRPDAAIDELVRTAKAQALVLAEVARVAPPEARAFHLAGMADPSGFVAMGMDELLVHTDDILRTLGDGLQPPDQLAVGVLDRLFPWWPRGEGPWDALRWANGRMALAGHEDLGSAWLWHCAPLADWDGRVPRWDPINRQPEGPRRN